MSSFSDWVLLFIPVASFAASWAGTMIGNRTDIGWLKKEVSALWKALHYERSRIDTIRSRG